MEAKKVNEIYYEGRRVEGRRLYNYAWAAIERQIIRREIASKYNLHIPAVAPIVRHLGDDDESDDEDQFDEPTPTTSTISHLPNTATVISPQPNSPALQTIVQPLGTPNTSTHPSFLLDIIRDWVPDTLSADK